MKTIGTVLLNLIAITSLPASEVTHAWTIGSITNRIGLLGIKDGVGQYRTQILYGPRWNDYWEVHLHIYAFVFLVFFAAFAIGFFSLVLKHVKKSASVKVDC